MDQGTLESLNFSALKFCNSICVENNHCYLMESKKKNENFNICKKVESFGVNTIKIKDNSTKNI